MLLWWYDNSIKNGSASTKEISLPLQETYDSLTDNQNHQILTSENANNEYEASPLSHHKELHHGLLQNVSSFSSNEQVHLKELNENLILSNLQKEEQKVTTAQKPLEKDVENLPVYENKTAKINKPWLSVFENDSSK